MEILCLIIGAIGGALITGVVAHRRPEWFNKAVAVVNTIDDKVNSKL